MASDFARTLPVLRQSEVDAIARDSLEKSGPTPGACTRKPNSPHFNALAGGTGAAQFALPIVTFPGGAPGTVGAVTPVSNNGTTATYTVTINNAVAGTFEHDWADCGSLATVGSERGTESVLYEQERTADGFGA